VSALVATCDATISQNGALLECAGTWTITEVPDYVEFLQLADEGTLFTLADLDSPTLAAAYAAGFTLIAMAWAVSVGVKIVLSLLR